VLVLALDTSTPAVTAGVVTLDGATRVVGERVTLDARAHGELLTPHLQEAVRDAGTTLRELDAVVCGIGPGPFTGLRAGIATAAALAHALGIPAYPVCGLDAIAADVPPGEPFLVATDARRREVYWAPYDASGTRVDGPHVQRPAEIVTDARAAAGHGADLYADVLGLPVLDAKYPTPAGLARVARAAVLAGTEPAPLVPLYLRRPDATEPGERKRVTAP